MRKRDFLDQEKHMSRGFTLIELIIALVMSLVIIGGIYAYCNSHQRSHIIQTRVNEMNQNIRVAMNRIVTEIRMAGYKTGSGTSDIMTLPDVWTNGLVPKFPYAVVMTDNLVITEGSTDPNDDMITFIYGETTISTSPNYSFLVSDPTPIDSTLLTLNLSGSKTAKKFNVGDIIYIGFGVIQPFDLEYAKIIGVSGSQLSIDTNAATPFIYEGLDIEYRSGTEVGLMNVVTYAIFNDENDPHCSEHEKGHPALKRRCNQGDMEMLAEDIESLNARKIGNDIQITLTARTSKEDPEYIHPKLKDHYRRRTLSSTVQVRNQ